ncbi:GNAT family N-acetyltransferase [Actinokineospora spheciospongiae]|uniref:GNAT family N-acetyltransferase n=1 Tax=Actinokineospora spheciospongiae TaxID=909613 RepID=UPI000D713BFD|nr:GNAT family N-acetyltransferase [Actinokineospora spheciospongiae]
MTVRPFRTSDADDAYRLRRLAFGGPREVDPDWAGTPGWTGLTAELGGQRVGFARIWEYRQFFGGRAVPMGGIASVAVAAHARGRRVASALLDESLPLMREAGQGISTLFPYVVRPYRQRGWEHAGVLERATVPLAGLASAPRSTREVRPATAADLGEVHRAYLRTASTIDGPLDRGTSAFTLEDALDLDLLTVVPGPDGITGYLSADRPDGESLHVHDFVADDADTAHALLHQLASWAGHTEVATVRVLDSALFDLLIPGAVTRGSHVETWMLRVVDLPTALADRGWPHAPDLTVDLDVTDRHAPWNAGRWRLTAAGGTVHCERGGDGTVRLAARALGPWYSGASSTAELRRAGLLDGDPAAARALDLLTGAPGGPRTADAF